MSTTPATPSDDAGTESTTTHRAAYECDRDDCTATFTAAEAVAGSFCSRDCHARHRGEKLLNNVIHDHCFCTNCGKRLKEVEPPTDETLKHIEGFHSTTCVVGYQYRTPHAATGEKDVRAEPGKDLVTTGTICGACGNTNTTATFPEDRARHLLEYAHGLLDALADLGADGRHDKHIDRAVFFDTLLDFDTRGDIPLALGRAIE